MRLWGPAGSHWLLALGRLLAFAALLPALFASRVSTSATHGSANSSDSALTRIVFGSCADQSDPQPIWDAILRYEPQLFIWLGDNIYADIKHPLRLWGAQANAGPWESVPRFQPVSIDDMKAKYKEVNEKPGYVRLKENTEVVGTWDDHDYGLDNSGKELGMKEESKQLLLDFLGEPEDSPRRRQDGVYAAYSYGPPGKRIKAILLDTRFNRDPIGTDGTVLGERQWAWLERNLRSSTAQINIIGSSIQVIANLSAVVQPFFAVEGWARFPSERQRLFDLIAATQAPGVVFISGDVHFTEINRLDCSGATYPLYEHTSSGLTQATELAFHPPFGFLQRLAALAVPNTMREFGGRGGGHCRYASCVYGKPNFGILEVNWSSSPATLTMQSRDIRGQPVLTHTVGLDKLRPGAFPAPQAPVPGVLRHHCTREWDLAWHAKYQLALLACQFVGVALMAPVAVILTLFKCFRWATKVKAE